MGTDYRELILSLTGFALYMIILGALLGMAVKGLTEDTERCFLRVFRVLRTISI